MDLAIQCLSNILPDRESPVIWALDEQVRLEDLKIDRKIPVTFLTNRVDQGKWLREQGMDVLVDDYSFESIEKAGTIFHRVSKQKALVHHLIHQSGKVLGENGRLYLSGNRKEGIKTYGKKAAAYLGGERDDVTVKSGLHRVCIPLGESLGDPIDQATSYAEIVPAAKYGDLTFLSKPGVFGWKKVDRGSSMLMDVVKGFELPKAPGTVLDLGCGYGFISVMAGKQFPGAMITATDNNLAAVAACSANLKEHEIAGKAVPAHCGDSISEPCDLVLCNPPFHKGFDVEGDLTTLFLKSAARLTRANGCALFVVNEFVPLAKKARAIFPVIEELAAADGFKVFAFRHRRSI